MKTSSFIAAAAVFSQTHHALASDVVPRSKTGIAGSIAKLIGMLIPDDGPAKSWDLEKYPNHCKIYMDTRDGSKCYAEVECKDGKRSYNKDRAGWNVCYVGGRQFFNDPRIGEFSITFTRKDSKEEGEGLVAPVLQLKNVGNWMEYPVTDFASEWWHKFDEAGAGPFHCYWGPYDGSDWFTDTIAENRHKKWNCGVPDLSGGPYDNIDEVEEGMD
ncbi:hypothetical protein DM02DRAFT_674542 [Periconia macrospinosa]|uniref:Uncharacterized protein n=1 Tax=Periconia macrospinosa TaxID=97972 RepID=A0A2V1DFJ0_9PLEO|nr:hypothetical protein DM02DRAFT_674542 [Periconia macrospinosa]